MAKNYSVFALAYADVIVVGRRKIDDVRPDFLKQQVIEILASRGLGPDGKPLPKEEEKKPEKPVEDKKEDEPSKDTKEEEKDPVEKDKGAK